MPDAPHFNMSPLDVRSLSAVNGRDMPRVGQHRQLPPRALTAGAWTHTNRGTALWRLRVVDPQALGVRVHFRNFHVGDARVWIHNGQLTDTQVLGPFSQDGVFHDGDFWTSFIFGEALVMEYEALDQDAPASLPFEVEGITHLWEFLGKRSSLAASDVDTSCELDAECYANNQSVADAIKPVVMIIVPGVRQCTATMMNDQKSTGTPYMLTAGHCITSDADARAVTVYWNYQSSSCNGSAPDFRTLPNVTGATLLSQNQEVGGLDYAFVQLSGIPNTNWWLAGWDTTEVKQNEALVSVSHPRGLPKRFAYLSQDGNSTGSSDSYEFATIQGRVDHGSSGSALFAPGESVRAVDSKGTNDVSVSACTIANQTTNWTKFSSIYARTKPWLEDQLGQTPPKPADMQSPAPGSTLPGSTVTFSWNSVNASEYDIYVGTTSGDHDLFARNVGAVTSYTVTGLPANGSTLYVRLWSHLPNGWFYNDYTYKAASGGGGGTTFIGQMTSPVPGSTLPGSSVTFTWTKSATASEYFIYIGTSSGGKDVFAQNVGSALSYSVGGLPTNGGTLYVRLWSHLDSWYYNDYTYTAASGGGGGGTTFTAQMTSPTPGSTLAGSSVTFAWTKSTTASEYVLYIGTTLGGRDVFGLNVGSALSYPVGGLPTNGSTVYVRLWSHLDSWYYNDYTYTAASGGGGGGGTTFTAQMTSPTPGSTLADSSVTFAWTKATTASEYVIYIGTTLGGKEVFEKNVGSLTSFTVAGLPTNGSTVYVRLWSHLSSWYYNDYTYTAASGGGGGGTFIGQMTTPVPGSTLPGSSVTFSWTKSNTATEYVIYIGTTLGGREVFGQNVASATSVTVGGLPTNGSTLYVRLWSHVDSWFYNDYAYTAATR
jgi:hypothetical protein